MIYPKQEAHSSPLSPRLGAIHAWAGMRGTHQLVLKPVQGWLPLDWLQPEAMHPALIPSKQEAIYVAVVYDFPAGSSPLGGGVRRFDIPEAGGAQ